MAFVRLGLISAGTFFFGVNGVGGVFSIRRSTSSSLAHSRKLVTMVEKQLDYEKYTGLSRKQLEAVGFSALVWNGLESAFETLISELAQWPREIGSLVTTDMGNVSRATLFTNLTNLLIHDALVKTHCEDVAFFFDNLRNRRNEVIHATIRETPGETKLVKRSAKSGAGKAMEFDVSVDDASLQVLALDMHLCRKSMKAAYLMVWAVNFYRMHHGAGDPTELHTFVLDQLDPFDEITPLRTRLEELFPGRQKRRKNLYPPLPSLE